MKKWIILFLLIISIIGCSNDDNEIRNGIAIVVEKTYSPSSYISGVSIGTNIRTGGTGIGLVSGSTSEEYVLVLQSGWDGIFTFDYKELWAKYSKGDTVKIQYVINKYETKKIKGIAHIKERVRMKRIIDGKVYYANN